MTEHTLVGKNYTTPDIVAKGTGPTRYADGMLCCKLLFGPMPNARVPRGEVRAVAALPGVKAIVRADDLLVDSRGGERALTHEPLYRGEPILTMAAIDELTAVNAVCQPMTILDAPVTIQSSALDLADPETPVGAPTRS